MKLISILIFTLALAIPSFASILDVPQLYETIQEAINDCFEGDTVLVEPGIYRENLTMVGERIVVASLFLMDGDTAWVDSTYIQGTGEGSVVTFDRDAVNMTLTGFTVTGGQAANGAGVLVDASIPTLYHVIIAENTASNIGGGIYISNRSNPLLWNVTVRDNIAPYGGGVWIQDSDATIENLVLIRNQAIGRGESPGRAGGMGIFRAPMTIDGLYATGNRSGGGGAVYIAEGEVTVKNALIVDNSASSSGAGISVQNNGVLFLIRSQLYDNHSVNGGALTQYLSSTYLFNCTIAGNTANQLGAANYMFGGCNLAMANTILWDNGAEQVVIPPDNSGRVTVIFSDVQGGEDAIQVNNFGNLFWSDNTNFDEDPLFGEDYVLLEDSPCIDTGTDYYEEDDVVLYELVDGDWLGDAPDIGALEFIVEDEEEEDAVESRLPAVSDKYTLAYAYPNPFNSSTTISYYAPFAGRFTAYLYDPVGRKVDEVRIASFSTGYGSFVWQASDHPSGLYFCRIEAGAFSSMIPIALVR